MTERGNALFPPFVRTEGISPSLVRISVNPIGRFGFIRSLFLLLFRHCQFYLK